MSQDFLKYRKMNGRSEFKERGRGEKIAVLLLHSLDCLQICNRQGAFHAETKSFGLCEE